MPGTETAWQKNCKLGTLLNVKWNLFGCRKF
jgi:hypothetical protein